MSHPFFDKIRRPVFESSAHAVINLKEIDSELVMVTPSMTSLKKMLAQEIRFFKAKR